MDMAVFTAISSLLATLLIIINIYMQTVRKPQEAQESNLREAERALNEFIATHSGEYRELKFMVDNLNKTVEELKKENKELKEAQELLARELFEHQTVEGREVRK